jgi:hypothetical protein
VCQKRKLKIDARVTRKIDSPVRTEGAPQLKNGTYTGHQWWSPGSVSVVFIVVVAEEEIGDLLRVEMGRAGPAVRTLAGQHAGMRWL